MIEHQTHHHTLAPRLKARWRVSLWPAYGIPVFLVAIALMAMVFAGRTIPQSRWNMLLKAFNPAHLALLEAKPADPWQQVMAQLGRAGEQSPVLALAHISRKGPRLEISLPVQSVFATAAASMKPESVIALAQVATLVAPLASRIDIHTHTDSKNLVATGDAAVSNLPLMRGVDMLATLQTQGLHAALQVLADNTGPVGTVSLVILTQDPKGPAHDKP